MFIYTSDINECDRKDKGGCDTYCANTVGSYKCNCKEGYAIFENEGFMGYEVYRSETGDLKDDILRYNHSCVSKYWLHKICIVNL